MGRRQGVGGEGAQAVARAGDDDRRSWEGGDREGAVAGEGGLGHLALAHRRRRQARLRAGSESARPVIGWTSRAAALLSGLGVLGMAGLVTFDVLIRYFFGPPPPFVDWLGGLPPG